MADVGILRCVSDDDERRNGRLGRSIYAHFSNRQTQRGSHTLLISTVFVRYYDKNIVFRGNIVFRDNIVFGDNIVLRDKVTTMNL